MAEESKLEPVIYTDRLNFLIHPNAINSKEEFHGNTRKEKVKQAEALVNDSTFSCNSFDADNGISTPRSRSFLMHLILNGFTASTRNLLRKETLDLTLRDWSYHATALQWAAFKGNCLVIGDLLNLMKHDDGLKKWINTPDEDGDTPLIEAAREGYLDAVKLLLAAGANPQTPNKNGRTALADTRHYLEKPTSTPVRAARQKTVIAFLERFQSLSTAPPFAQDAKNPSQKPLLSPQQSFLRFGLVNPAQNPTVEEQRTWQETQEALYQEKTIADKTGEELIASVKDSRNDFFIPVQSARNMIGQQDALLKKANEKENKDERERERKKAQRSINTATETLQQFKQATTYVDNQDRTAWDYAVLEGNIPAMIELIKLGADVNRQDFDGYTALNRAASIGNINVISILFSPEIQAALKEANTSIFLEQPDHKGNTPLANAAEFGQKDAVAALLAQGASCAAQNNSQKTPLQLAGESYKPGTFDAYKLISNFLAEKRKPLENKLQLLVKRAAEFSENTDAAYIALLESGKLLPSHAPVALKLKHQDIQNKARLRTSTDERITNLLNLIIDYTDPATLPNDAVDHEKAKLERTKKLLSLVAFPLSGVLKARANEYYGDPRSPHIREITSLIAQGVDPKFSEGFPGNLLIYLILHDYVSLISQLLQQSPNPIELIGLKDSTWGDNALSWAVFKGNPEVVQMLLNILKDNNHLASSINAQTESGRTPLIEAISRGNIPVTELLIAAGADFRQLTFTHKEETTSKEKTAFELAESLGRHEIIAFMNEFEKAAGKQTTSLPDAKDAKDAQNFKPTNLQRALTWGMISDELPVDSKLAKLFNNQDDEVQRFKQQFNQQYRERRSQQLINAIKDGDKEKIAELRIQDFDIHYLDCNGFNVLHHATMAGDESLVMQLLQNPDINLNAQGTSTHGYDSPTALQLSAEYGRFRITGMLLKANAGLTVRNGEKLTPLQYIQKAQKRAATPGKQQIIEQLTQAEANASELLHHAAKVDHWPTILQLVQQQQVDINKTENYYDENALEIAAGNGHAQLVSLLIQHGAEPGEHIAEALTQYTPAVNKALKTKPTEQKQEAKTTKAAPNRLIHAAKMGDEKTVRSLLQAGTSDLEKRDEYGYTPLHWAAQNGHTDTARALLEHKKADIEAKDFTGFTPLACAALHGNLHTVQLLIRKGADIGFKDAHKKGLADLAIGSTQAFLKDTTKVTLLRARYLADRLMQDTTWTPPKDEEYLEKALGNLQDSKNSTIHALIEDLNNPRPASPKEAMARLKGFCDAFKTVDPAAVALVNTASGPKSSTTITTIAPPPLPKQTGWGSFWPLSNSSSSSQTTKTPVRTVPLKEADDPRANKKIDGAIENNNL